MTAMGTYKIVRAEMERLPSNTELSHTFATQWSGTLCVDGKFVKVRGHAKKIPFIYGIDYSTHDIPCGLLALSESFASFDGLFSMLQGLGYPLRVCIGDDSAALQAALQSRFPRAAFQLCQTHYLENVRGLLRVRTDGRYLPFFASFSRLFVRGLSREKRMETLKKLRGMYDDRLLSAVIADLYNHYDELFAYEAFAEHVPHSNNLIEAFNSHLNARLASMKGFESLQSAALWLNAWMLRRRTKPFTDCEEPFRGLNGRCSIETTMRSGATLKDIFRFLNM